jgi:hypothetical protein
VVKKAPKYVYGAGVSAYFFTIIYFNQNHTVSDNNVAKFIAFSVVYLEFNK